MIEGLCYAFPRTMAGLEPQSPRLTALHDRVMARPRIAAYLSSSRRLPFNQQGIFRHYPELEIRVKLQTQTRTTQQSDQKVEISKPDTAAHSPFVRSLRVYAICV